MISYIISLLTISLVFMKIGAFTVGGGMAMLPVILSEMLSRGWMTEEKFTEILGLAEATPGPLAVNTATFVGFEQLGIVGAIVATLSLAFPSFLCVVLLGWLGAKIKRIKGIEMIMPTLRFVVTAMIFAIALQLAWTVLASSMSTFSLSCAVNIMVAIAVACCVIFSKISPVAVLLAGAVIAACF